MFFYKLFKTEIFTVAAELKALARDEWVHKPDYMTRV